MSITCYAKIEKVWNGAFSFSNEALWNLIMPDSASYNVYGPGTYSIQNGVRLYNGTPFEEPARLVCQKDNVRGNIYIAKIDGKVMSSSAALPNFQVPAGITTNDAYLKPGLHSIEVGWFNYAKDGISYSQETVIFTHVITLESGIYDLTGERQGGQILFRIRKR
jgi:hypothetical protein